MLIIFYKNKSFLKAIINLKINIIYVYKIIKYYLKIKK